jgi:CHAD domain-containing protein
MKARKVDGLDPAAPFAEAAARIAQVREGELHSFWPAARDPAEVEALHDMRIAAKRLRYVLELAAPALGAGARARAKQARELQDLLGEIHDCDVMLPLVEGHEPLSDRFRGRRERLHADFLDMWRRMES